MQLSGLLSASHPCTLLNHIPTVHVGSSSGRSLIFLSAEPPLIPCHAWHTASSTSDHSRHEQGPAGSRTDSFFPIVGLTVQAVLGKGEDDKVIIHPKKQRLIKDAGI